MTLQFALAWRNLWRNPRRTWLTVAAMVFANALLIFMISLQLGGYQMMINNSLQAFTGHLQVQAPGYLDDPKLRRSIAGIDALAERIRRQISPAPVAVRAMGFALASSEQRSLGLQLAGVDPMHEPTLSTLPGLMVAGRYLADTDAPEIVIGSVLARNLKVAVGDEITLLGSTVEGAFAAGVVQVVGIFESGMIDIDRQMAQLSLAYFRQLFAFGEAGHAVVISAPALSQVGGMAQQITPLLPAETVLLDWQALVPGLKQAIQADFVSAWFMYAVLVVLVAFSVLNTQLMSVLERTREFGTMMALGLAPCRLAGLVLLETLLMAGLGLLLGVVLGLFIIGVLQVTGFAYPGMDDMAARFNLPARIYPQLSVVSTLLGPAVVFMATLLAAVYPALRLYRLRPLVAMRAS